VFLAREYLAKGDHSEGPRTIRGPSCRGGRLVGAECSIGKKASAFEPTSPRDLFDDEAGIGSGDDTVAGVAGTLMADASADWSLSFAIAL